MKPGFKVVPLLAAAAVLLPAAGCLRVKVDPIETKEIRIVHDVNIRIDKQLDDFFAFQDPHSTTKAASVPATQAAIENGDVK